MPSFEMLLPLGAVALYLYDAMLMLYGNELVLERHRRGWRSRIGVGMTMGGRQPYLPNPFAPGTLLFRAHWDAPENSLAGEPLDVDRLRQACRPLRIIVVLQVILLLIVLPPVSLTLGSGRMLLAIFAAYYTLSIVALAVLAARRGTLHVSGRQYAVLAFESLVCAPFAANLVRKVSLARSAELGWLEVATQKLPPSERRALHEHISRRIQDYLSVEEPESVEAARLESVQTLIKDKLSVAVAA